MAFPMDARADRYIFDPVVKLREQPSEKANFVRSYLPLFGMKNIGPNVVDGEWEMFEYIEFPLSNKPQRVSGWIKSKQLVNEQPTPETLRQLWQTVPASDKVQRKWLALTAIEIVSRGMPMHTSDRQAYSTLAKDFADEYKNIDADIAAEVAAQKENHLIFILPPQSEPVSSRNLFEPLVLKVGPKLLEPFDLPKEMDRSNFHFLRLQVASPEDQLKQMVKEIANAILFLRKGAEYGLYKDGVKVGQAHVNELLEPPCGTCQGFSIVASTTRSDGRPLSIRSNEVLLATNTPFTLKTGQLTRAITKAEEQFLLSEAKKYLKRKRAPSAFVRGIKSYGGRFISLGNSQNLLVSSFGYSRPETSNDRREEGQPTASPQLLLILKQDDGGNYQMAYDRYLMENNVTFEIHFMSFFDLDFDGIDELILQVRTRSEDGSSSYYEILSSQGDKYHKLIETGTQSMH